MLQKQQQEVSCIISFQTTLQPMTCDDQPVFARCLARNSYTSTLKDGYRTAHRAQLAVPL